MDRRVAIGVGIAVVFCAIAMAIAFALPAPAPETSPEETTDEPDGPPPEATDAGEEPTPEEALEPATELPSIWGEGSLGTSHCAVIQPTRRVEHDFDDAGRLIRTRTWRRGAEGPALRPYEVTRYEHGAEGREVQVRHAIRARADDPYADEDAPDEAWRVGEQRIEHSTQGEWLHQRVTDAEGERERLFRLEDGRVTLESPLRVDDLVPESSRCLFDASGRPLLHQAPSGHLTEWRYDEHGVLAAIATRASTEAEPTEIPVTVDDDGAVTVLLDRYDGDCGEVVFADCSAVMSVLPGPRLPEGLLPGTR